MILAGIIADGRLLDLLRRVYCFGTCLMKMDLRQESSRHNQALDALTRCVSLCCAQLYMLGFRTQLPWRKDALSMCPSPGCSILQVIRCC